MEKERQTCTYTKRDRDKIEIDKIETDRLTDTLTQYTCTDTHTDAVLLVDSSNFLPRLTPQRN